MEWAVRARVDGVITDNPALYLEVCARWLREEESRRQAPPPGGRSVVRKAARFGKRRGLVSDALSMAGLLCMNLFAACISVLFTILGRYDRVTIKPRAKTR